MFTLLSEGHTSVEDSLKRLIVWGELSPGGRFIVVLVKVSIEVVQLQLQWFKEKHPCWWGLHCGICNLMV